MRFRYPKRKNSLRKKYIRQGMENQNSGDCDQSAGNFFGRNIFVMKVRRLKKKKYTKWMDYDKIEKNPYIRTRRTGDYMVINAQGNTKKLNRCMIDEKIPSEYRDSIPLIACGKEILWMVGSRMNERYKINPPNQEGVSIKLPRRKRK